MINSGIASPEGIDRGLTMQKIVRFQALVLVLVTVLVLQACSTAQRVHQGSEVAKEGMELTKILPAFYDEYYKSAIRADSVTLQLVRQEPGITAARLREQLQEANTDLLQTGKLVEEMKDHARLLHDYFVAILDLTDDEVGEDFGESTKDLIQGMEAVREELPDGGEFGFSAEKAGKPSGNFVVVALKSKALKKELETHGAAIEAELDVQEAVLDAIGESMTSNHEAWVSAGLEAPLFETYESKKQTLSRSWIDSRVELLTQPDEIAITEEAKDALKELRLAWRELAGGGPKRSTMYRLRDRVDATGKLVGALAN